MKTISYTGRGYNERLVAVAMLTSTEMLRAVAHHWDLKEGMLASKEANLVCGWAVKHFQRTQQAPGRKILGWLDEWMQRKRDKAQVALVEKFIQGIDSEFEKEPDVKFALHQAEQVFNKVRLERGLEAAQAEREREGSTPDDVRAVLVEAAKPVNLAGMQESEIDDEAALTEAFSQVQVPIVTYPGAAGEFFGDDLCRSGLIAFIGPQKTGKTRWLMDIAWRTMLNRKRVLYYSVGDLTKGQTYARFAARACNRPIKAKKDVLYPKGIVRGSNAWEVEGLRKSFANELTPKDFLDKYRHIRETVLKSKESFLKIRCAASNTVKASEIKSHATLLAHQGWTPDAVVVDYADILAPENSRAENTRDQVNLAWKILNGLRQELDCLVVTATQANAGSFTATKIGRQHQGEDIRKAAHVTGMIGINQMDADEEFNVQKLNWVVRREAEAHGNRMLVCAGVWGANNPCVRSLFPKDSDTHEEEVPDGDESD